MELDPALSKIPRFNRPVGPTVSRIGQPSGIRQPQKVSKLSKYSTIIPGGRTHSAGIGPKQSNEKIGLPAGLITPTLSTKFANLIQNVKSTSNTMNNSWNDECDAMGHVNTVTKTIEPNNDTFNAEVQDNGKILRRSETFIREDDSKSTTVTSVDGPNGTYDVDPKMLTRSLDHSNLGAFINPAFNDSINPLTATVTKSYKGQRQIRQAGHGTQIDNKKRFPSTESSIFSCSAIDDDKSVTMERNKSHIVYNSTMRSTENLLDASELITPVRRHLNLTIEEGDGSVKNTTKTLHKSTDLNDYGDGDGVLLDQTITPYSAIIHDDLLMDIDNQSHPEGMDVSFGEESFQQKFNASMIGLVPDPNQLTVTKSRFSLGLDLIDCTLDCSIELCENSISSSTPAMNSPGGSCSLPINVKRQQSFEMDESLGILTPEQMKEFLDSSASHNSELPIHLLSNHAGRFYAKQQYKIVQTPSPEELPLDTVAVAMDKTEVPDTLTQPQSYHTDPQSQTDTESRGDQMTKSTASKASTNSIITSITSITSLDTGYQGDGEMSRPASRGADQSPSNGPRINKVVHRNFNNRDLILEHPPIARRQDPMTDSDFFTESDADDLHHRGGDRRAQVIDGHLYGPMQIDADVFIDEQAQNDDSCMESSGIFTDAENQRNEIGNDMSPDGSTDTVNSGKTVDYNNRKSVMSSSSSASGQLALSPQHLNYQASLSDSTTSTVNSCVDRTAVLNTTIHQSNIESSNAINDEILNTDKLKQVDELCCADNKSVELRNTSNGSTDSGVKVKTSSSMNRKVGKNVSSTSVVRKRNLVSDSERTESKGMTLKTNNNSCGNGTLARRSMMLVDKTNSTDDENQENKKPSVRRTPLTNKWDAVMNKIAENKSAIVKRNYSDVKSKVTTIGGAGSVKRTPLQSGVLKSNSSTTVDSNSSLRTLQPGKRGRNVSKDSSASDLSLSGGSPKVQQKSTSVTRAAKKRDVRTITLTPTDLGPPSKTNITNGTTTKSGGLFHKRSATNNRTVPVSSSTPIQTTTESKGGSSPPAKKLVSRSNLSPTLQKQPLKDQNRLHVGVPSTAVLSKTPQRNGVTLTASPHTPTAVATCNGGIHHTIHTNGDRSTSSSPKSGRKPATTTIVVANSKVLGNGKLLNGTGNNGVGCGKIDLRDKEIADALAEAAAERTLRLANEKNLHDANKGVEALGVLIQYLVNDLDAFVCPGLKKKNESLKINLEKTETNLIEANNKCHNLEDTIIEQERRHVNREEDLKNRYKKNLLDAEERIHQLADELHKIQTDGERKLKLYVEQYDAKLKLREDRIKEASDTELDLLKKISSLTATENQLREKIVASENDFGQRLHAAAIRERELLDKLSTLTKQFDDYRLVNEQKQIDLNEKLQFAKDEIRAMKSSRSNPSSPKGLNPQRSQLQEEIDSLRCVLELKQTEIADLRKHCNELQGPADELPNALMKINALESRIEDLQVQLKIRTDEESELREVNKRLNESVTQESKRRKHLSNHNEELRWRLQQNSAKYSHLVNYVRNQSQMSSEQFSSAESNCFQMDDISPPPSPNMKNMITKSDSVSWVLQLDDESPEALVSRDVRRANNFRASFNDRSSVTKHRPISPPENGRNPLSQSASTSAILNNHSDSLYSPPHQKNKNGRNRSNSVSKTENKKLLRANSLNAGSITNRLHDQMPSGWKEPICASSPYHKKRNCNVGATTINDYRLRSPDHIVTDRS